jgi:hypothetical protein
MKQLYTFLAVLLMTASTFAQAPGKMSYQAVVRDSGDALVTNQAVGMQISILQTTATGTAVYVETQTPTTNVNGLVTLEIGTGSVVSGDFTTIDWSVDSYFIKTETDPTGGASYTITGTSQLLSVPYALHAKTAENVTNDLVDDADADPMNEIELPSGGLEGQVLKISGGVLTWAYPPCNGVFNIGDTYGGGIVFYVDGSGCHGLIASAIDQSAGAPWGCNSIYITGADGIAIGTGNQNTIDIEAGCPTPGTAADICANLTLAGYTDWYLPSKDELYLMRQNIGQGNALGLGNLGTFSNLAYYSSTEASANQNYAWGLLFSIGAWYEYGKTGNKSIRAVRAF